MPISMDAFRNPKWIKLEKRYPMSYDEKDRFNEINPRNDVHRYPGDQGREGGWKQAGYNPDHNSTTVERIVVRSDNIQLKPR